MPRRSAKRLSAGVDPTPRRSTRLASRENAEDKHHLDGREEAIDSRPARGRRTEIPEGHDEEEDREESVYPVSSSISERQPSPREEQHSFTPSPSPPRFLLQPPNNTETTMDPPESHLRGGDVPEPSPRSRRHSSSRGSRPPTPTVHKKRPKEDLAAHLAAAQVVVESKYEIPDSLRYKVGNLETKIKPKLDKEIKEYYERNPTDTAVVSQRANLLSIVEPLVKVYGDPQRRPEDAVKDGRALDGLKSWFEESVLGRIRILPNGRDIKTELLGTEYGAWRPTRLGFTLPLPEDGSEVGNEWFGAVWQDLYLRVSHFAELYFGEGLGFGEAVPNGGDIWDRRGVWDGIGGKKELVWLVSQVARQDNAIRGGWDALLARAVTRKLTIVGMVAKLLQQWVFDELLFGADESIGEILRAQDEGLVQVEGYRRKRDRAEAISAYFRGRDLPELFWDEVDKRSIAITMRLLPFLKLMDKNFNNSRAKSLQGFHQQIHDIVAQAGYIAVQMARSKDIFYFSAPFLGQTWDVDHNQVDDRVWVNSSEAVYRLDKYKENAWEKRRDSYKLNPEAYVAEPSLWDRAAELGFRGVLWAILGFIPSLLCYKVPTYETYPDWKSMAGVTDKEFKKPPHQGKVQIIVWPKCERFGLVGDIDPKLQTSKQGESITTLLQAQVAYYQGRTDDAGAAAEGIPTLFDWLDQKRKLAYKVWWDRLVKLLLLFLLLAVLSHLAPSSIFSYIWILPKVCFTLAKYFVLVVLDAIIWILTLGITFVKIVMFVLSAAFNTVLSWFNLELVDGSQRTWRSPSWGAREFGWGEKTIPGYRVRLPGHEGQEHTLPWYSLGNWLTKKQDREPDYLDKLLGVDFEKKQKKLEAKKEKARQRASEEAEKLKWPQPEKDLEEEEEEIEITKVIDFIPGPITPPPTSTKTKRMTLKKSWTRKGEEPGPEIWEEHTPGVFEAFTEKAKDQFKDKVKEKYEEQKRLVEWRKTKAKQDAEEKEGEAWKKYIKPDWYAWFGGATEDELRQQEEERLAFEAAQEATRETARREKEAKKEKKQREKEAKKEKKQREKEEVRSKKLREVDAKEKEELEEIQREERELELEMARQKAGSKTAPRKVKPEFSTKALEDWWNSNFGDLSVLWQPLLTIHYPVIAHKDGEDSDTL
ncbi:hypothetical protein QBC40DRAFT_347057 [Triangularia verruculosa]|uniref:Uncharacterized protein n=1 Tax=Triangularia verruculosa TaxID=2587418 RepID=A0AAN6XNL5_9PEZI|nr:hypothetical protein QBC40DRAFT_347057 [Triangularia verruculosa]